jgi:AAA domain
MQVIAGASLRNPLAATSSSTNFNASVATKKIRILVCAPSNTAVDEVCMCMCVCVCVYVYVCVDVYMCACVRVCLLLLHTCVPA